MRSRRVFLALNDPRFEEKLVDVVGLYLNPPENAIVLCMDEKSQIQALDRTSRRADQTRQSGDDDPRLQAQRHHDPFAALDVLTGSVIGQCLPRHRHVES